ncbi:K02A2.6-like [Cordylochernes scorpioides]|uniref:K02A2.6-like n=1 Tax=Cordylochernes scorpioides TaxID=51811 RepID=A0ABY6JW04_9ARAC|nr:K02A2.6-like [Cordylochernes scorpioides]
MNLQRNKTTQIEINDYTVEALIDTGAVVSCIDEVLSYKLKLKVIKDNNLNLKAAGDQKLNAKGRSMVSFNMDQEKYTIQMMVLEKCNPKIILGDDFLSHYKALINCRNNTLWIESPNNMDQDDTSLKYVRAVEDRIIPEFSLCLVKGFCEPTTDDKEILIENLSSLTSKYGLITTRSLLKNTRFPDIWLLNPSSKPIKIHRHMKIGIISEVDRMYKTDHRAVSSIDLNFDINPDLSSEECNQVLMLLYEYKEMFAAPDDYKGRTHLVRHKIKTNSDIPIRKNPYRVSLREREIINNQIDKMLKKGIISHSSSPWASPVILVKKKDGTFSFCVDYRNLNSNTVKDQYPLPRIDDCFDSLHGSRYFTSLDLCSGYWQVEVEEQDREKTAFVTPDGLYHFNVLPFGLCNGPATFERLMDNILRTHKWKICLCYLDDVIVFSEDLPSHLTRLKTILGCLRKAGLTLNLSKCRFAYEELLLLVHVVSKEGITPDPEKIANIKDFPALKTIKNVRAFLGLCSYYRRFIKEFSKIAYPLKIITRKNQPFVWGKEQESSFLTLKEKLSSPEVLTHYDPNKPIGLHTDASDQGLGAVLIHVEDNGRERPISYASRTLQKAETNYSTTKKECLAIIWAIGKFRPYLYGRKFITPSQQPSGQLQPIPPASRPFERIGIDLLGRFPKSSNGNRWIVVCTDYYSRHVETAALPRGTATEIADFFLKRIVLRHGAPKILISDRGSSFLSKLLTQVLKICNTIHKKTTSYHPQTNGQTERMNRTLTDMILMYIDEKHQNWDEILPFVTFAYNSSVQETTGYSPYFLIHGREPLTFLDSTFDWPEVPPKPGDFDDYISNLLTIVEESKKISMARTMARQDKSKQVYDKHRREVNFSPDDLVLIWTPIRKVGRADKLQKNYIGPFKIIRKTSPVNYEVKEVTGRGKKIVHVSRMKLYRTPDLRTNAIPGICSGVPSVDYIKALENKLGRGCIVQLGKVSGQVLVNRERHEMAETIIENGLLINGALPFQKKAKIITISNLSYIIEDADIVKTLRPYCQVVSNSPAVNTSGGYTWLDLKKTASSSSTRMGHKRNKTPAPAPITTAPPPAAFNHPALEAVPVLISSTPSAQKEKKTQFCTLHQCYEIFQQAPNQAVSSDY